MEDHIILIGGGIIILSILFFCGKAGIELIKDYKRNKIIKENNKKYFD